MLDSIFRISQLTTSVATILGSAYIWVSLGMKDGVGFLIFGGIFTIILRLIEQMIFEDNYNHGRLR